MPKRFHITFSTIRGDDWTYEIHDTDHVDPSTEIMGRYMGFRLGYDGENDVFSPVFGSELEFNLLVYAGIEPFVNELAAAREGRFTCALYRGTALYWVGYIVNDQVRFEDRYYPYNLSITAVDGTARLKEIDYKNNYTGRQTVLEHLYNIISHIGLTAIVTMPATRFRTNVNFYETTMATNASPLTQATVDHERFREKDSEGNTKYWTCYDVLVALSRMFLGRFFMAEGKYYLFCASLYKDSTQKVFNYNAAGALTGTDAAADFDLDLDYVTGFKRAGGSTTYFRPLQKVQVDYHHLSGNNRAHGFKWSKTAGPTGYVTLPGEVGIDADDTTKLKINIPIRVRSELYVTSGTDPYPDHRYYFRVFVKISGSYLKRHIFGDIFANWAEDPTWVTGAENYVEILSPMVTSAQNGNDIVFNLNLTTPYLDDALSGYEIEVKILLNKIQAPANVQLVDGIQSFYTAHFDWDITDPLVEVLGESAGNNPGIDIVRYTANDGTLGNTGKQEIDTWLGDGPRAHSLSRLQVAGTDTTEWKLNGTGTGYDINELIAREVLAVRQTSVRVYQGQYMIPGAHIYNRFIDGSYAYVPIRANYNAFEDTWDGEYALISRVFTSPVVDPPFNPGSTGTASPGTSIPINPAGPPKQPTSPPTTTDPFPSPDGLIVTTVVANTLGGATLSTGQTAAGINGAGAVTISPVAYSFVKEGDTVTLYNPSTGVNDTVTVAATPAPNATSLSITGTVSNDYPAGTVILPTGQTILQGRPFSHFNWDFTGTVFAIPVSVGILPYFGDYSETEMRRRVKVWRSGVRYYYSPQASPKPNAFYTTADRINFFEKCRNETIYIEVTN